MTFLRILHELIIRDFIVTFVGPLGNAFQVLTAGKDTSACTGLEIPLVP